MYLMGGVVLVKGNILIGKKEKIFVGIRKVNRRRILGGVDREFKWIRVLIIIIR